MTSFAHVDYPTQHPGVVRAENAIAALKNFAAGFDGARGAASLMLAAVVAALVVVANQVIDTWGDGHLMAAWMLLWAVAFMAIALFATPARRASVVLRNGYKAWVESRRQAAEDQRTWNAALQDARMMADLSRAMTSSPRRISATNTTEHCTDRVPGVAWQHSNESRGHSPRLFFVHASKSAGAMKKAASLH
jgi:hypothetical protein